MTTEYPNLKSRQGGRVNAEAINVRCPYCSRNGAFSSVGLEDLGWQQSRQNDKGQQVNENWSSGLRSCPNQECRGVVAFIRSRTGLTLYPAELKEFDPGDLPQAVRECMEEAIKCHAQGCYRAAAIMVRRSLEVMCEERGATGPTLEKRIEALRNQIVISQDLIDGAHELRFLGNDAAHVEAKAFARVGREEAEAAIDVVKEMLRATYQTASLVRRLCAMKQPPPP